MKTSLIALGAEERVKNLEGIVAEKRPLNDRQKSVKAAQALQNLTKSKSNSAKNHLDEEPQVTRFLGELNIFVPHKDFQACQQAMANLSQAVSGGLEAVMQKFQSFQDALAELSLSSDQQAQILKLVILNYRDSSQGYSGLGLGEEFEHQVQVFREPVILSVHEVSQELQTQSAQLAAWLDSIPQGDDHLLQGFEVKLEGDETGVNVEVIVHLEGFEEDGSQAQAGQADPENFGRVDQDQTKGILLHDFPLDDASILLALSQEKSREAFLQSSAAARDALMRSLESTLGQEPASGRLAAAGPALLKELLSFEQALKEEIEKEHGKAGARLYEVAGWASVIKGMGFFVLKKASWKTIKAEARGFIKKSVDASIHQVRQGAKKGVHEMLEGSKKEFKECLEQMGYSPRDAGFKANKIMSMAAGQAARKGGSFSIELSKCLANTLKEIKQVLKKIDDFWGQKSQFGRKNSPKNWFSNCKCRISARSAQKKTAQGMSDQLDYLNWWEKSLLKEPKVTLVNNSRKQFTSHFSRKGNRFVIQEFTGTEQEFKELIKSFFSPSKNQRRIFIDGIPDDPRIFEVLDQFSWKFGTRGDIVLIP